MERQNITLSLPKSLLKKAKVVAAKKETSLSELVRAAIEEKVRGDTGYKRARERQVRLLKMGLNLGTKGAISFSREELYARR
jgi:metal-responsive CopG/Arc/MetJ family transcriptional regulator